MLPCILLGNYTQIDEDYDNRIASDQAPRVDYIELARHMSGTIPLHPLATSRLFQTVRNTEKRLRFDFSMSGWIASNLSKYNVIVSVSESTAIPLAGAMKLTGQHVPHVLIGHRLTGRAQRKAWQVTKVHRALSAIACVSQGQVDFAKSSGGMGFDAAHFVYDKVDQKFFHPLGLADEGYILSVGQEQRDYSTLIRAVSGLDIPVVIVASSPWATSKVVPEETKNVRVVGGLSYVELRDLYAHARLVVVPVHDVDYAAGVNGMLEGMAMAKPVVSTKTSGLRGYVEEGTTGLQVPPADHLALREVIRELWDDAARRDSLGAAGRAAIETHMGFENYVHGIAQIAYDAIGKHS